MMEAALLLDLLKKRFGFSAFRPGQMEAIQALLQRGRLLCIQPTGHGKSLLYQLPSCLLEGITLVISPLLALMRDQIEHLNHRFQIPAASVNSDQSEEENADAKQKALRGEIKVLFVSPEQLDHIDRFTFLLELNVSLVVVDEAHCISTWGHDFRPSYRQILHFIQALEQKTPSIKILGLTATADDRVEKDIVRQLSSAAKQVDVFREQMDRPNIELSMIPVSGIASKLLLCTQLMGELKGSGLIYCATRENTELVAEYLQQQGVSITAYHAGLGPEEKRRIQSAFSSDAYKAVAATTALGMGIDKSNLRFIIHFDIPGSITAYYQEVGRCGRDGLKAEGVLLYDPADRKIQEYFIDSALPTEEDFEQILSSVRMAEEPPNLTKIRRATGLHPTRVLIVVAELVEQGHLVKESVKGVQVYKITEQNAPLDLSRYLNQHAVKIHELDQMLGYAQQTAGCRMALLRKALGDKDPAACGHCDICLPRAQHSLFAPDAHLAPQQWLASRPIPIAETRTYRISPGLSLLDGKLRSPLFVRFMKERAEKEEIDSELLGLLKTHATSLAATTPFTALVLLPSTTWMARGSVGRALAEHLDIPFFDALLLWKTPPEKRQGELLNNDQRQYNVQEKMQVNPDLKVPPGPLLLLDDYIGSGATLKEAARVLRKKTDAPFVPLTIANLKWRLGKAGFI